MASLIEINTEEPTTSKPSTSIVDIASNVNQMLSVNQMSNGNQMSNANQTSNVTQTKNVDQTSNVDDDFKVTLAATYLDDALLNRHIEFR